MPTSDPSSLPIRIETVGDLHQLIGRFDNRCRVVIWIPPESGDFGQKRALFPLEAVADTMVVSGGEYADVLVIRPASSPLPS